MRMTDTHVTLQQNGTSEARLISSIEMQKLESAVDWHAYDAQVSDVIDVH